MYRWHRDLFDYVERRPPRHVVKTASFCPEGDENLGWSPFTIDKMSVQWRGSRMRLYSNSNSACIPPKQYGRLSKSFRTLSRHDWTLLWNYCHPSPLPAHSRTQHNVQHIDIRPLQVCTSLSRNFSLIMYVASFWVISGFHTHESSNILTILCLFEQDVTGHDSATPVRSARQSLTDSIQWECPHQNHGINLNRQNRY